MARQRFIHPSLWDDPDLGKLPSEAMLLYIACFSNADDDGRLVGDLAHLKALAFRYRRVSEKRIGEYRDMLVARCSSFHVYTAGGTDYIAFLNWKEFQHPKYPKPSALPEPGFPQASPKEESSLPPQTGLGGDGLEKAVGTSAYVPPELLIQKLLKVLPDKDDGTKGVLEALARKHKLPDAAFGIAMDAAQSGSAISPTKVAISVLKAYERNAA